MSTETLAATLVATYPTVTLPGNPDEMAALLEAAVAADDPEQKIRLIDQALDRGAPTPDLYLVRSVAFDTLGQRLWWVCDVRAAGRLLQSKPETAFPIELWQKTFARVTELEATQQPEELAHARRLWELEQLQGRGSRALERRDAASALHWFGKALARHPSALTMWFAAVALLGEGKHALAAECLELLATTHEGRSALNKLVAFADILAVREQLTEVIAGRSSSEALHASVLHAMRAKSAS